MAAPRCSCRTTDNQPPQPAAPGSSPTSCSRRYQFCNTHRARNAVGTHGSCVRNTSTDFPQFCTPSLKHKAIMNEDNLKTLFDDFNPDLTPDGRFLSRLEQNLRSVEVVKEQIATAQKKKRLPVIIAALTGFIVGFLSTLAYPFLHTTLNNLVQAGTEAATLISDYSPILIYTLITLLTGTLTYIAYDLTSTAIKSSPLRLPQK